MPKGVKLTTEEFILKGKDLYGDKFDYSKAIYTKGLSNIIIGCPIHGDVLVTARYHLQGGFGCSLCGQVESNRKRSIMKNQVGRDTFVEKAKIKHGDKYDYSKVVYDRSDADVTIICKTHGQFPLKPTYHLQGQGCQECSKERTRQALMKPFDKFLKQAKALYNDSYEYVEESYTNAKTPMSIVCDKHGPFLCSPDNHISKMSGCPKCVHQISSQEEKLAKEFPLFKQTERSAIAPLHLDLYSKEHNLAVEVNGRYWHSEENGKGEEYHITKTQKCLDSGISLLHFWDDEVDRKSDVVFSMIRSRIGLSEKVYARSTMVKEPDKNEVGRFLDSNHIQGAARYTKAYGLYLGDELVSLMTFGKPRFAEGFEWEIIRFATKLNTNVIGGASKLFATFLSENKPSSIITYADRRYSEGKVYEILGFEFSHNSRPNYFYSKGAVNLPRYKAQKHKLLKILGDSFDESKSETANMLDSGFYKVYDCGNKVFHWRSTDADI